MTITETKRTKKGNIAVSVDGEFLFSALESAWLDSGLFVGDEVTEEQLNELLAASNLASAKKKALNMLSSNSYTERQLKERLSRTHDCDSSEAAVERMKELGLVNDSDYALRFAEELYTVRSYAPRRIRFELSKRGLSRDDIDMAIESLGDIDEVSNAISLLERKYKCLYTDTDIRRAASLLERYGYGYDAVKTAIHAVRRLGNEEYSDEL